MRRLGQAADEHSGHANPPCCGARWGAGHTTGMTSLRRLKASPETISNLARVTGSKACFTMLYSRLKMRGVLTM